MRADAFAATSTATIAAHRRALIWLVPYQDVTTVQGYLSIWQQIGTHNAKFHSTRAISSANAAESGSTPVGYLVAGSAYALKQDGSLGEYW